MNKLKKIVASALSFTLIMIIIVSSAWCVTFAADMQGKGTKTDPYIITTADQLNNIRKNLKAHYKLGNTIDLSKFDNFVPIGNLANPFTGSLSCDTDGDGYPLYAIKNLKMTVAPKGCTRENFYPGYKDDGTSGWEAGLFGCSKGGQFTNIIILDADLTSKVEGATKYVEYNGEQRYMGESLDDMGTGILLAMGDTVTVTGCGATGKVVTASNHAGGLLGKLNNAKVTNSYCYATVVADKANYSWGSGGLVGSMEKTTISSCFYSGKFTGSATHAGALAGSVYAQPNTANKIENCWAAGTVMTESSGCFLGTKVHTDGSPYYNTDVSSWGYTLAKIKGRTKAQTNKRVKNNNYVADEKGIFESGFAVMSQAELNEIFKANSAWVVKSGTYPQLKDVHPVKNSKKYVVKEIVDTPATDNKQEETGTETETTPDTNTSISDGNSESGVKINVNIQNDIVKLGKTEKVLAIVFLSLAVVMLIATVAAVILACVRLGKASNSDDEDE